MGLDSLNKLLADGEHALDLGKYRTARQKLVKAVSIDPKCIKAHFYLALAELNLGHFKEAEKDVRYVLKQDPQRPNAHLNLGVIKIRQGDVTSALRLYNKELKFHPDCYEAHYNLGLIYLERKKWKKVIYHLEKCWRNNHQGKNLEEHLALAAQRAGRLDLEVEIYKRELRKNGKSVWALNNLAACRNAQGRHTEASTLLGKAMELAPSDKIVRSNLKDTQNMGKRRAAGSVLETRS